MTDHQAREYCRQANAILRLADDNSVYFANEDEQSFEIKSPSNFRSIGFLSRDIARACQGGLLWLHMTYGAEGLAEAGERVLENLRQARGDLRSLDEAPAQNFDSSEELDLQIALMQIIGNGWNGDLIPSSADFVLSFRSSHRFICYSDGIATHNKLLNSLSEWSPSEVYN